jgi:hypothetical protein
LARTTIYVSEYLIPHRLEEEEKNGKSKWLFSMPRAHRLVLTRRRDRKVARKTRKSAKTRKRREKEKGKKRQYEVITVQ